MAVVVVCTPEQLTQLVEQAVEKKLSQLAGAAPKLLDRKGIAKALTVSVDTIDDWRKLGMPSVQLPGSYPRFIEADCVEWARNHGKKPSG